MSENGKLTAAELTDIPGGQLANEAAAAWLAPGGPAEAGLRPGGPESSYRTIHMQEVRWQVFQEGGPIAAPVGSSMHGLGVAIDNPNGWEQSWIHEHGARYGWVKSEAFSEPWHFNYNGSKHFDLFVALQKGDKGKRVKHYTRRLAFIHREDGPAYLKRAPGRFGRRVEKAVRKFQFDNHLQVDGVIGAKTGAKIDAVFHHQYRKRHQAQPKGGAK